VLCEALQAPGVPVVLSAAAAAAFRRMLSWFGTHVAT
jgi:hypothetical protein